MKDYQPQEPFSPVPYFLVFRAIELELKARHLEEKSRKQVKGDYWHNIKKAYDELDDIDKILADDEYAVLEAASDIYKST